MTKTMYRQQSTQITKHEWLGAARQEAVRILKIRRCITIADVLMEYPLPEYLHKNVLGWVFKDDVFRAIGYTKSRSEKSHSSPVRVWALNYQYFPVEELTPTWKSIAEYENE